jgi:hypothetical protein
MGNASLRRKQPLRRRDGKQAAKLSHLHHAQCFPQARAERRGGNYVEEGSQSAEWLLTFVQMVWRDFIQPAADQGRIDEIDWYVAHLKAAVSRLLPLDDVVDYPDFNPVREDDARVYVDDSDDTESVTSSQPSEDEDEDEDVDGEPVTFDEVVED